MLEIAQKIDGWMSETELAFLYAAACSMPDNTAVAEIGSWKGRSTVAILEALKHKSGAVLYAIDTFKGDPGICVSKEKQDEVQTDTVYKEFLTNTADYGFLKIVRATSEEASHQFQNESLDWVFIDADHSYDAVCADVHAWFPKLKFGGLLAGHDYGNVAVTRAVDRMFKKFCVWDTIWYTRRNTQTPLNRTLPTAEVTIRRRLLRQVF